MKNLVIIATNTGNTFEAITRYLKDVKILLITDKTSSEIIERAKYLSVDYNTEAIINLEKFLLEKSFDLVIFDEYKFNSKIVRNCINIHPSLNLDFNNSDIIKEDFLSGIKVSGVTLFNPSNHNIITQYPFFVTNDMHFDEYVSEIEKYKQTIYPLVIEKLLKNEVIEAKKLLSNNNNCQGENCKGVCSHCKN